MNKDDKAKMFDCLARLNSVINNSFGEFDINNGDIKAFIKNNDFYIEKYGKRNKKKAFEHNNYIVFVSNRYNGKFDLAHDILRHIRNAIAHSLVSKKSNKRKNGDVYYSLTDYNKNGNESMIGQCRLDLFYSLIDALIGTRKQII